VAILTAISILSRETKHFALLPRNTEAAVSLAERPTTASAVGLGREPSASAQCNDAYWHGVFGGIYAPHLRTEMWRELVRAETLLDALARGRGNELRIEQTDFDADGSEELYASGYSDEALDQLGGPDSAVGSGSGAQGRALDRPRHETEAVRRSRCLCLFR
jgi:hypothetical protein